MDKSKDTTTVISRRKMLSSFGLLFMLNAATAATEETVENKEYTEVIDKDGKLHRIPVSTLNKAKVVKANASNKEMFNWLKSKKS